jgi:starch synthase
MADRLHVAFLTSELDPFVKTGGLADVSAALPKALARLGHRVTIFLPRYRNIAYPPGDFAGSVHVPVDAVHRSAGYFRRATSEAGVEIVFVEHPPFFDRENPYGDAAGEYSDNRLRFAFFVRAVLEYFRSRGERPSVFHANDWQTGLLPVYLKAFYWDDPSLQRTPTIFTIHNIAYQGRFGADTVATLGLPWNLGTRDALEYHGGVSYLKGGIQFSEVVTTVSPQYAREIQTPEFGLGMDEPVRGRAADLLGILNGVDYDEWDPARDPHIAASYSSKDLTGKAACKADLLRAFSLPSEPDLPIVGITSRLVYQKGFDIVAEAWWDLLQRPLRMVALGTGERSVEDGLRALAARDPSRFAVQFAYDTALAHKIEAGADMFLMPSRFEPCGLNQMYSMRYGTVPVVHAVGGLADTVTPKTGFSFQEYSPAALAGALQAALAAYTNKRAWRAVQAAGMRQDFSWDRSAKEYVKIYDRAIKQRLGPRG